VIIGLLPCQPEAARAAGPRSCLPTPGRRRPPTYLTAGEIPVSVQGLAGNRCLRTPILGCLRLCTIGPSLIFVEDAGPPADFGLKRVGV